MYRVTFKEIHPIVLLWLPSYLKAGHKQCSNSVLCFICDSNIGQHFNTFSERDGAFKNRMKHIHCIWFHARPLYQRIALGHTFWWTWYFNFKALSYKNKKSHKSDESKWSGAMRDICSAPANSFPTAHDKKKISAVLLHNLWYYKYVEEISPLQHFWDCSQCRRKLAEVFFVWSHLLWSHSFGRMWYRCHDSCQLLING